MTNREKINKMFKSFEDGTMLDELTKNAFEKFFENYKCARCNYTNCNVCMCKNLPIICWGNQEAWLDSEYDSDDTFWSLWYK